MKLGMWSSEGHCGHQASLELVNTDEFASSSCWEGAEAGPRAPLSPIISCLSQSSIASSTEDLYFQGWRKWETEVCPHGCSVFSCSSLSSFSCFMSILSFQQLTYGNFRPSAGMGSLTEIYSPDCMSTPYNKPLIPYHSWWFHSLIDGWQRIMPREQSLYPNQRMGNESLDEFQYPCPGIVLPPWILASSVTHFWLTEYGRSEAPWLWG